MSYRIYNHLYSKDQLTCIYYDPDTRETSFTFQLGTVRKIGLHFTLLVVPFPKYTYAKEREVSYVVRGKIDVPHTLADAEIFDIASVDDVVSISYTDKEQDEYKLNIAYYIVPYIERVHREMHTVEYK